MSTLQLQMKIITLIAAFAIATQLNALTLQQGWNLIGFTKNNVDIQTAIPNASIAWMYKNNEWLVTSPNSELADELASTSYRAFSHVDAEDSFWVYLKEITTVEITGENVLDKNINLSSSWSLKSLKHDSELDLEYYFNDPNISIIWKYIDNQWLAYSPLSMTQQELKQYNYNIIGTIKPNEGFWVHAQNNISIDFNKPHFHRIKNTTDNLDDIWNIKLPIDPNTNVLNFDVAVHMVKKSSLTIGNFVIHSASISNKQLANIAALDVYAEKTTGTAQRKSYNADAEITKKSLLIEDDKLVINLGAIINLQDQETIDKFSNAAEYEIEIYVSALNIGASYILTPISLKLGFFDSKVLNTNTQLISGNLLINN